MFKPKPLLDGELFGIGLKVVLGRLEFNNISPAVDSGSVTNPAAGLSIEVNEVPYLGFDKGIEKALFLLGLIGFGESTNVFE